MRKLVKIRSGINTSLYLCISLPSFYILSLYTLSSSKHYVIFRPHLFLLKSQCKTGQHFFLLKSQHNKNLKRQIYLLSMFREKFQQHYLIYPLLVKFIQDVKWQRSLLVKEVCDKKKYFHMMDPPWSKYITYIPPTP